MQVANDYFEFKHFTIRQNLTAMKVGTDGVLLGAWSKPREHDKFILDIGSGTGIIAIMLAQKTEESFIHAIEIEENAFKQACDNAVNSPWEDRIKVLHVDFNHFVETCDYQYDLIVSNPPYFEHSKPAPEESRNIARHSNSLERKDLINGVKKILHANGVFNLILPVQEGMDFIELAESNDLYCNYILNVMPNIGKDPKRLIMQFGKEKKDLEEGHLAIELEKRHEYSDEYKELTKDFYLNF